MNIRSIASFALCLAALVATADRPVTAQNRTILINAVLNGDVTAAALSELGRYGTVVDVLEPLDAVTIRGRASAVAAIRDLPFVAAAEEDGGASGSPVDTVTLTDFADGSNSWNLDVVDVTDAAATPARQVSYDGDGVYVAVLDTGLQDSWRTYFPQEQIAEEYATTFQGASARSSAEPTNAWEHDQHGHGTHVTSTILGYNLRGQAVNGVAPRATVIPVKVLNNSGFGFWYVIARGIVYAADLRAGALGGAPMVISMSIVGRTGSPVLEAAIEYAVNKGAIVVAAAGNTGLVPMGYPASYPKVISVAAAGWTGQWMPGSDDNASNWWRDDVEDPTNLGEVFIASFSSRANATQDLDVAAPGHWVLGPVQWDSGNLRPQYQFWSGTSMATPHVSGIVALMAQKYPQLTAAQAESILEAAAVPLAPGCVTVISPFGGTEEHCWGPGHDRAGQDADGHGLITAPLALAATPL